MKTAKPIDKSVYISLEMDMKKVNYDIYKNKRKLKEGQSLNRVLFTSLYVFT